MTTNQGVVGSNPASRANTKSLASTRRGAFFLAASPEMGGRPCPYRAFVRAVPSQNPLHGPE